MKHALVIGDVSILPLYVAQAVEKVWFYAKNVSKMFSCLKNPQNMTLLRSEIRADFVIQQHQSLWFTFQFKAISECRQRNSLNQKFKTNKAAKLP